LFLYLNAEDTVIFWLFFPPVSLQMEFFWGSFFLISIFLIAWQNHVLNILFLM
jgi:hypothetical protein